MSAHCRKIGHSYFVVMEDHGKLGLEANVHPERTRRNIVEMIKNGDYEDIVFIHHIDGLYVEDVTSELIDEAELHLKEEYRERRAEQRAAAFDHAQDNRKNEVA